MSALVDCEVEPLVGVSHILLLDMFEIGRGHRVRRGSGVGRSELVAI